MIVAFSCFEFKLVTWKLLGHIEVAVVVATVAIVPVPVVKFEGVVVAGSKNEYFEKKKIYPC